MAESLAASPETLLDTGSDYVEEVAPEEVPEVVSSEPVPSDGPVTLGYEVEDSEVIKSLRDQPESAAVEIIVITVIFMLVIGGVVFYFLSRRKGQAVPTTEPEEGLEEEEQPINDNEKFDGTVATENA